MHVKPSIRLAAEPTASGKSSSQPSTPSLRKTILDTELLQQAQDYPSLEQQVIVHCQINPGHAWEPKLRIWPSTYLIPKRGTSKAKLLQAKHISFYPEWTPIRRLFPHHFTLIFEGLPKDCTSFDLLEEIPETGGFEFRDIPRNPVDIYTLIL
jgi:hypothetical protein